MTARGLGLALGGPAGGRLLSVAMMTTSKSSNEEEIIKTILLATRTLELVRGLWEESHQVTQLSHIIIVFVTRSYLAK